jgi:neutral ceramidase
MTDSASTCWAGAALVDTTPPLGTVINGDFVAHYATYIHDPLHAKALVLRKGPVTLTLVVVDICVMGQELLDYTKKLITEAHGIPAIHVMISSTHTHAAGAVEEVHLVQADLAYRSKLPGLILQAVSNALDNLQPAQIAFGKTNAAEHVLCRRYQMDSSYEPINPVSGKADKIKTNPFGVEDQILRPVTIPDPELSFLAVKGLGGEWISILGNYSLHYVGDWENGTVSADYFGVFSDSLKEKLNASSNFVGMMSNGTSGDINIWDFLDQDRYPKGLFEKSKLIGEDLASKVVEMLPNLDWEVNPNLGAVFEEKMIARRMPTPEELRESAKVLKTGKLEHLVPNTEGWKKLYAREQLLLAAYPASATVPLQLLRIGSGRIGALPGEFFAATGLRIKEGVKDPYFTITLANGNVGYVPPAEELANGGYETWRCRISNLHTEAEEEIRTALMGLILSA